MTFRVLGAPKSGYGVPYISVWNVDRGDADGSRWIGRSYAWYSTSATGARHVSETHGVRAFVTVSGDNEGWYDLAKVRLTYRYAILR